MKKQYLRKLGKKFFSGVHPHFLGVNAPAAAESLPVGISILPIIEAEKIDFKVSRSTVDLDFQNFLGCSPRPTELFPVGINLLAIIEAEKIDLKVSRSKYFRSPK